LLQAELFLPSAEDTCCQSGSKTCSADELKPLEGEFMWSSVKDDVARVEEFDVAGAQALVTATGLGMTQVVAEEVSAAERLGNITPIAGLVNVSVGSEEVHVAFVVDTTMEMWCNLPEDSCTHSAPRLHDRAGDFWEKMKDLFALPRGYVISYSTQPSRQFITCPNPLEWCGILADPCKDWNVLGTGVGGEGMVFPNEYIEAFGKLRVACVNNAVVTGGPAGVQTDIGTSMFSALIKALDILSNADDEAFKAIVLVGGIPGCYDGNTGVCVVEPVSGISLDDVITMAQLLEVKIFAINILARNLPACAVPGQTGDQPAALESQAVQQFLVNQTGGEYYPSSIIVPTACGVVELPTDQENVLTALEDLKELIQQ